jgi:hypothetical protein
MATKKTAAKKATKAKKLAAKDLRAATLASVKAAMGKLPGGGIINGFILDPHDLEGLGQTPAALAKEISARAGAALGGVKLKPVVIKRPGGILVGFLPPALRAR